MTHFVWRRGLPNNALHTLLCVTIMNYTPRYAQPFTLHEAVGLDVSTISEGSVHKTPFQLTC